MMWSQILLKPCTRVLIIILLFFFFLRENPWFSNKKNQLFFIILSNLHAKNNIITIINSYLFSTISVELGGIHKGDIVIVFGSTVILFF